MRDRVHILLLENLAKVFLRRRSFAHLLLRTVGELLENIAVHIADVRDAGGAPVRLERGEMSVGAAIQPNHGKVEAIIGTENLAIALCRGSHGQPRRAHRKCIEKLTSCSHHFSLSLVPLSQIARHLSPADKIAGQQEIPAFVSVFLSPSMLMRVDASGVPAPRQWVSRLSP